MTPPDNRIEKSEQINELALALSKFQSEVQGVKKDGDNPFFHSKYATLEGIITTVRSPLAKHGLAFAQFPCGENGLTTLVLHTSGQYIAATFTMKPKDATPQGVGSAITYARRYALSAALGIATEEDDDGNAASSPRRETMKPYTVPRTRLSDDEDETGAAHAKQPEPKEIDKSLKIKIAALLKDGYGYTMLGKKKEAVEKKVKDLTQLDLTDGNYEAIVEALERDIAERRADAEEFDQTA
jgi:hypothetical protein